MSSATSKDQQAQPAPTDGDRLDPNRRTWASSRRRAILESAVVFLIGAAIMHQVYTGSVRTEGDEIGLPGHDSFYHVKMASLLPEHGLLDQFHWLRFVYFTEEGQDFVSHHYGFHVLLLPFVQAAQVLTGDYLAGGRLANMTFLGLNLMLLNLLLMHQGVRWRWLWLLIFVLMPFQFFTRHAYVRAIAPSLTFMLLILLLMFRGRYRLTGLAVAAYTHLYLGGVTYAPVIVGVYVFSMMICPREDRIAPWRLVGWASAGWIVGVATHPYLGGMLEFLQLQIFGSGLTPDISVGREWKPYQNVWWFAQMTGILLGLWIVGCCLRMRLGPRLGAKGFALLLLHVGFLALTTKARRFIEYWPVFCLLSAAWMSAPHLNRLVGWFEGTKDSSFTRLNRWFTRIGALVLLVVIVLITRFTPVWREVQKSVRCNYDLPAIREAMMFLQDRSEPGDVIFTDDWDIFPALFYHNTHNHFIVGLDPKFTQARRPELWERYVKISRGQIPTDVAVTPRDGDPTAPEQEKTLHVTLTDIRDHFGARFVITDGDHQALARKLSKAPEFAELIYPLASFEESLREPFIIFRIRDDGEVVEDVGAGI